MARGGASSSVLRIIIEGDASGASEAIEGVGIELADAARAWAAFEGVNFLRGVTEQAADLQQAQAMVDQTFGASSSTVREFAEGAADALGQSEEQAAQAAGSFGYLLQTMGVGQEEAAKMSTRLLQLAADLAAFKNTSIDEALTAIQSGLAGEMEPMRRYGAVLSVARIEQEALAMGLDFTSGKMDTQTRALATYSLMLKDTGIAAGQLAREHDSLEASQNRANANWENAKAQLGTNFIPLMTKATEVTGWLADGLGRLDASTQLALTGIIAYTTFGARAITMLRGLASAAWAAGAALAVPSGAVEGALGGRAAAAGLSKTTAGVIALTAAWAQYQEMEAWRDLQAVGADAEALAVSLERLAHTGTVVGELGLYGDELERLADAFDKADSAAFRFEQGGLLGVFSGDGGSAEDDIDKVDKALASLVAKSPEVAAAAYAQVEAALALQGISADEVAEKFDDYNQATETAEIATANQADAARDNAGAQQTQAEAIEEATKAQEEAIAAAERRLSAEAGLATAAERRWTAAEELADAERAVAGDSEEHRRAAEALADAHEGVADAQERVAEANDALADAHEGVREANEEVGRAQRDLNDAYREARDRLRDLKIEAREAADAQRQAALDVQVALAERDRILQDSTASDLEKQQAQLDYEQALTAQQSAQYEAQQAAQAASASIEQDEGVIRAKEALRAANDGVTDAYARVEDAAGRVREAQDGVRDAERRVADAQKETAKVAEDASKRLVAAQRANEEAAFEHAAAIGEAEGAMNGAEAGTRAWMDALRELAAELAPGSELAQRIQRMLSILGTGIRGGPVRSGDYGSADAAEAAREAQGGGRASGGKGPVGSGDYGSADAAEGARGAPRITFNQTVNGSSVEVQREMERQAKAWLDEAAREMSGG